MLKITQIASGRTQNSNLDSLTQRLLKLNPTRPHIYIQNCASVSLSESHVVRKAFWVPGFHLQFVIFFFNFIYLFIFCCACLHCCKQAFFALSLWWLSCCRARGSRLWAQWLWPTVDLVALWHVESSQIQGLNPCPLLWHADS